MGSGGRAQGRSRATTRHGVDRRRLEGQNLSDTAVVGDGERARGYSQAAARDGDS